jgi:hypothetical protein
LVANRNQSGVPKRLEETSDDVAGVDTIKVLTKTLYLAKRITGNDRGSLGLHAAVYFYGPTGRHSGPMFMGTMALIARKLANNDGQFFQQLTAVRARLESILILNKDLIATILQRHLSAKRVESYADFLDRLVKHLTKEADIREVDLIKMAGLDGKIVAGAASERAKEFSDEIKSKAFIAVALASAIKCPVCNGYLDPEKSVSYDHVVRAREGGRGISTNCQLTHPYCNQSVKQ